VVSDYAIGDAMGVGLFDIDKQGSGWWHLMLAQMAHASDSGKEGTGCEVPAAG
jgi:hypothetical protein